eukprot:c7791_g1_i1 orf=556-1182(+)
MVMRYQSSFLSASKQLDKGKSQASQESINWELLKLEDALSVMEEVPQPPSVEAFTTVLFKCKQEKSLTHAMRLLTYMREFGLETHETLGNYLVPLLMEVGSLCDAEQVFNRLVLRNEYSWNALIAGFVKYGDSHHALMLFQKMSEDSVRPSGFTYVAVLKACANLKDVIRGQELHNEIARIGLERDLFVGSSIVDLYVKCGLLAKAQE